jgi:hypothetical protein
MSDSTVPPPVMREGHVAEIEYAIRFIRDTTGCATAADARTVNTLREIKAFIQPFLNREIIPVPRKEIVGVANLINAEPPRITSALKEVLGWIGMELCGCGGTGSYEDFVTGEDRICKK